jgi:hypothetical protein
MRFYPILLTLCFALVGCSDPAREEVISRFDGGEKRVVVVYRGTGTGEHLVTRQTFDIKGTLLLLEDLEGGTRKTYGELNPQYQSAAGLAEFVRGTWHEHKHSRIADTLEENEHNVFSFGDSTLRIDRTLSLNGRESAYTQERSITYRDGLRVALQLSQEDLANRIKGEPEPQEAFAAIELTDPETMLVRDVVRYEGGVEIGSSIVKLHRNEGVSLKDAVAWGAEIEEREQALTAERNALIERHYPLWAVNARAQSDRSSYETEASDQNEKRKFAEKVVRDAKSAGVGIEFVSRELSDDAFERFYGFRRGQDVGEAFAARAAKKAAERAGNLRELLQRINLAPEQYRTGADMNSTEFREIYGFGANEQ